MRTTPTTPPTPPVPPGTVVAGVDVGATKTQAVLYGPRGEVARSTRPTRAGAAGVVSTVTGLLGEVSRGAGAPPDAVGIGIPGVVDTPTGTVSHGVNLGLGRDVPLGDLVAARVGAPVTVLNDVTAATLGAWHAMGRGGDLALLSVGTGLAAGLVLDGHPRAGARAGAGEVGHIPWVPGGQPCRCGQRGCLEVYASGGALARMWPTTQGSPASSLFAAVDAGDPAARAVHDTWMGALAQAVTILGLTVDVGTVALSGGVTEVGERFTRSLRAALDLRAAHSPFLRRLDLASRLVLVDPGLAVAPLGACLGALRRTGAPVASP